ncbi:hypothetical protein D3C85_1665340 [compost metagenome]
MQIDRNRRGFGIGNAGAPFDLLTIELQGPRARFAVQLNVSLIEGGTDPAELADL